jgi:hypothetical protein
LKRLPRPSAIKQIRKFCVDCCQGSIKTIQFCAAVDCALWNLRFGTFPATYVKRYGNKVRKLFDKENFKKGGKYSSDQYVEDIRL